MITFIDGPQLVGKSTLINYLVDKCKYRSFKFEFSKYSKIFNIEDKRDLRSYQIGKDCSTLYWIKELANKQEDILIDRGVMSTIYYSLLLERMGQDEILDLLDLVAYYNKDFKFVFIISKNKKEEIQRNKDDGFDYLNKDVNEEILKFMLRACKNRGIKFTIFKNNFSKSIEENGKILNGVIHDIY